MQFVLSVRGPKDKRNRYTREEVCRLKGATLGAIIRESAVILHGEGAQVERINDITHDTGFYQAYTFDTDGCRLNPGVPFSISNAYPFFVEDK